MKRTALALSVIILCCSKILAQDTIKVSGKVSSETDNKPIPGVNIVVQGTSIGTLTSMNGFYSIEAPTGATLSFSFIGYETIEVNVSGKNTIDVQMKEATSQLSEVVVVGSRAQGRTKLETPAPVDIINIDELSTNMPQMGLADMLVATAPSFNAVRSQGSDLSSHVDPPTLRGLAPNQMLVLINGKRRHTSALLNASQTGTMANAVDMSFIPTASIERVEILRDGAAAQYGSDAIAGVMNIVQKKGTGRFSGSFTAGGYPNMAPDFSSSDLTAEELALTRETDPDGFSYQFQANYGFQFKNDGYLNLTAAIRQDKRSIRPTVLSLDRAPLYNSSYLNNERTDINGMPIITNPELVQALAAGDMALADELRTVEGLMNARGIDQLDAATYAGQPAINLGSMSYNLGMPIGESTNFYSYGDIGFKYTEGFSCFYRRASQTDRFNYDLYPNGFRPQMYSNQVNVYFTNGVDGKLGDFNFDVSNTFGSNAMNIGMFNTYNASIGPNSPIDMDLGKHSFFQNTTNIDVSRYLNDVLKGLNIAGGTEMRIENYQIEAGQEESWTAGNYGIKTASSDDEELVGPDGFPLENLAGEPIVDANGNLITLPYAGYSQAIVKGYSLNCQCFRGFGPENEGNEYRTVMAAYLDLELDVTKKWMVGTAARAENYSDFGSVITGKVASRYSVTDDFALRGSYSTGFRAPSLQELNYSHTYTFFVDLVPYDGTVYPNTSTAARAIGIKALSEERSTNFSFGFAAKLFDKLEITVDAYRIDIKDRIFETSEFDKDDAPVLEPIIGKGLGSFRINGGDVSTQGLEIVANYSANLGRGVLTTTLSGTFRENKFEGADVPHLNVMLTEQQLIEKYVDRGDVGQFETGTPTANIIGSVSYGIGKFSFMLRGHYYGEVTDRDNQIRDLYNGQSGYADQTFSPQTTVDLGVTYKIIPQLMLTVGGNNIFNNYPDIVRYEKRDFYIYSNYQQGSAGAYYFGRLSFNF
ncbi:TonB-dependent receptor [Fulvivirga sediminis]|uniref:TonB-dependent receptor n=1 Tax=Fulvivirga sediminis TaxID=2803949 RepID=A0A937F5S2_9BACT|nr:TonB-dependent receptor [Fulvivirga sediminis]MBL3656942.1 TonB-dependent receptor [Fulvivirga sediminis]